MKTPTAYAATARTARPWQRHLARARAAWPDLSDEELLSCAGDAATLADMVQKRYAIPSASADQQVAAFFRRLRAGPAAAAA